MVLFVVNQENINKVTWDYLPISFEVDRYMKHSSDCIVSDFLLGTNRTNESVKKRNNVQLLTDSILA